MIDKWATPPVFSGTRGLDVPTDNHLHLQVIKSLSKSSGTFVPEPSVASVTEIPVLNHFFLLSLFCSSLYGLFQFFFFPQRLFKLLFIKVGYRKTVDDTVPLMYLTLKMYLTVDEEIHYVTD